MRDGFHHAAVMLACVTIVIACTTARAQIVPGAIALPESITGTLVLSDDRAYQILNSVTVKSGGLLSIPAGTLIYGNVSGAGSWLQVERGGKIYARGTAERPIVFTSAMPQGARLPGDWGGLVILGRADINAAAEAETFVPTGGIFGGTANDDSSGVLSFVRIEYAGRVISPGNRISGLTLAGVGNRTVINNVQITHSGHDSYEWLGGTVNGRNIIALAGTDDDFQFGLGYQGRVQFAFAMRDSSAYSADTSRGIESRNDATGSARTPFTRPILSNVTLAGPFRNDSQATGYFGSAGYLLQNSRGAFCNSVLVGWQEGMRAGGAGIAALPPGCPQPSDLRLRNNVISSQTVVWGVDGVQLLDMVLWFLCHPNANPGDHPNAGIRGVTQANLDAPDPRPLPGSPAASGADFTDAILTSGNNFSFSSTGYKGAFDPNRARELQWDSVWTNYRAHLTTYMKHRAGWNQVALANTPLGSNNKDFIYPAAISNAFRFNGSGYVVDNTLDAGVGYWVMLGDARTVEQKGATVPLPRAITVIPGWNLIASGASAPASVANITASGTTILSNFFGFDNGYASASRLEPGRAYWVNVSTAGTLTLNP